MGKMFVFSCIMLSSVTLYSADPVKEKECVEQQVREIDLDELFMNKPQSSVTLQPAPQKTMQAGTAPSKGSFFSRKKKRNVRPRKPYFSHCPRATDCCSCLKSWSEPAANAVDLHNQVQEARSHNNCSRTESADNDQSCTQCSFNCPDFSCPSCPSGCGSD